MEVVRKALLTLFALYQVFELVCLLQEVRSLRSYSPIWRALTLLGDRLWLRRLTLGYDLPRTFAHGCCLLLGSTLLALVASRHWLWLSFQAIIMQCCLFVLLIDQLYWVRSSMSIYFQALLGRLHFMSTMRSLEKDLSGRWDKRIRDLQDQVQEFSVGKYTPYFLSRFLAVVTVSILTYSAIYYFVSLADARSFVDTSHAGVSYLRLLYHSVMISTTIGTSVEPRTAIAHVFSAIQGLVNLYLFVLVISFFASISERQVHLERSRLLTAIERSLTDETWRENRG